MNARTRRLRNALLSLALLGLGLWWAGSALWQLGHTAMYVHESVVVTGTVIDVRQKPFESWAETLGEGNLSWPGDVSYQPIVQFSLPGGINAIRNDLPADNVDYSIGQQVSIISPPGQPGKARLNLWKFLWGAACLRLGIGSLLALIGYALLQRRQSKGSRSTAPATAPARRQAPARQSDATPARPTRRRKSGNGDSPAAPRKRKKAEATTAESKPRRSRKKKSEPQQQELPF